MEQVIGSHSKLQLQKLIQDSSVRPDSTLLQAISALNRSDVQLALVMDEGGKLAGILLDGDVRRALLAGYSLNDSIDRIYTRDFIRVSPDAGRAEVVELMQSRQIRHVPSVDAEGRLTGIHFWSQMLTLQERPNAACILAGGLGTRLYPLTRELPKPMLKVAGRPILERVLMHLIGHGLKRFYVSVNFMAEVIMDYFGDGSRLGCKITYLEEQQPLGTGGPLSLIEDPLTHPLLVMNGDLVTQAHVGQMLDYHLERGCCMTIASRLYQHIIPFGCLELQGDRVEAFEEKPVLVKPINAGIYVLQPELLRRVPRGCPYPMTRLIEELLEDKLEIASYQIHDDWVDVGLKQELDLARGH